MNVNGSSGKALSPIGRTLGTILLMAQKWTVLLGSVLGTVMNLSKLGQWFVALAPADLKQSPWDAVVIAVFADFQRAAVEAQNLRDYFIFNAPVIVNMPTLSKLGTDKVNGARSILLITTTDTINLPGSTGSRYLESATLSKEQDQYLRERELAVSVGPESISSLVKTTHQVDRSDGQPVMQQDGQ